MPDCTSNGTDRELLRLRGVSVTLGGAPVLEGVDLDVAAGEIVTLIGPNGAGKTTLLRVALGLLVPDRGEVHRRPGARVGYMPQRLQVDPTLPLSVRRFLTLGAPRSGPRVEQALERVGAGQTIRTAIHAISGGETQRVLLARALLRDPELLVLDEPTQGVDLAGQEELFALITGIRDERRCGVLMVSHDLHLVMGSTDRVVCLNRSVCCTGAPHSVGDDPAYRRLFPASTPGLSVYAHRHGRDAACDAESHRGR
jgi:zinc transport system ATP-binding protein